MILPPMTRPLDEPIGIQNYTGLTFRCFTKGDTLPFRFTIKNADGTPYDITNCALYIVMADKLVEVQVTAESQTAISVSLPISDAVDGIFEGNVPDEQTNALNDGLNFAQAIFLTAAGAEHIIDMAVLEVYPSVKFDAL